MVFAYDNNIEDYTITGTSYSEVYSVNNIQDKKLTKIFKGTNSDNNQRIVIDAGVSIIPELFAILGHNFTTETISIEANSSDVWGAPAFSYQFTEIKDIMYYQYSGVAYRYWSIYIENCDIPYNPPEIGLVYMGDIVEFTDPSVITPSNVDDNTVFEKSADNTLYAYKGETIRQNFQLGFNNNIFNADFIILKSIFSEVGKAYPFIIIWDTTEDFAAVPNIYCNFMTGITIEEMAGYEVSSISFTVEECK